MRPLAPAAGLVALALAALASAAPPRVPPRPMPARKPPIAIPKPPPRPPPADLPGPIGVARVRVEVGEDRVQVTTALTLPRGGWRKSDLDAFVAFGGPGLPSALDARLCATPAGSLVAPDDAPCAPLTADPEPRAPAHAALVVGRRTMAGELVHLPSAAIDRALAPSGIATLVLRELRALPPRAADGARELLVRLGATGGAPWILGQIEVAATDRAPLLRVEARLCGPNIDETPLAAISPAFHPGGDEVAPPLAPRATTDDLCVRFR